jgi:hypothetical protein
MHTQVSSPEAHGAPGFLPWHRAYLLDLERELQNIDPSVALPYWRFDQAAPNLFVKEFIGTSDPNGTVLFRSHPELNRDCMYRVKNGKQKIHRGWFNPELTKRDEFKEAGSA